MSIFDKWDKNVDTEGLQKDIAEAEANGGQGDYREVPVGTYEVKIDKMEIKECGSEKHAGEPMFTVQFRILEGDFENSCLFMNQLITEGWQIGQVNKFLSLEKFVAFENKSKLTNAKKLLKAKNSPVLQMKKNDLLENLKKHSRYKTMFKFEEDHIVISSQKEAAAFIKMLNDDIVRSELTGKEYDSSSKMLLGPVGASH